MSAWLTRALASPPCGPPVPNVSESPKRGGPKLPKSDHAYSGDYDTIGTGGAVVSRASEKEAFGGFQESAAQPAITYEEWLARFEERAAIREFESGFDRAEAERLAHEDQAGTPQDGCDGGGDA